MKYRAAATQIKEIPVIFRGTIDGADIPSPIIPDPIINQNISSLVFDDVANAYFGPIEGRFDNEEIFVSVDDVLYSNVPKHIVDEENNIYTYGAYYDEETGIPDFSEYPFVFIFVPDIPLGFTVGANENDFDLKVWTQNPDPIYPDPIPTKKKFMAELTGNGQIKRFHCRFALGENGTLHIKPYVILNGNIRVDLCAFASNGDNYISGDNEEIAFDCYVPVETHAVAYVEAENVGEYESILDAAMVVQYEDYIEPESIVGYEGINLNRR